MSDPKRLETDQLEAILEWDINNCNAITMYGWSKKEVKAYMKACQKELNSRGVELE